MLFRSSSNNPFSNSRFSTTSTTTAFTNQKDQESNVNRNSFIKPTYTGTNPFRLETGVNNNNINSKYNPKNIVKHSHPKTPLYPCNLSPPSSISPHIHNHHLQK